MSIPELLLISLGALLIYCAVKDKNPVTLVKEVLTGEKTSEKEPVPATGTK